MGASVEAALEKVEGDRSDTDYKSKVVNLEDTARRLESANNRMKEELSSANGAIADLEAKLRQLEGEKVMLGAKAQMHSEDLHSEIDMLRKKLSGNDVDLLDEANRRIAAY